MTSRKVRRTTLGIGAIIVFLVLVGATYQGVATALERRTFPRPGGMVDVGGHQLHIHCSGEGAPTVVLEAPAAGMSAAWGRLQPRIAAVTRVCSYDRAGLGWSERSDAPYDPLGARDELRALLDRANEPPPFVVAGHGLGAAFARLFVSRFADETPALILVDTPSVARPTQPAELLDYPAALPWLARTGVMRLSGMLSSLPDDLPDPDGGALAAFLWRPDHLSRTAEELARWSEIVDSADGTAIPPTTTVSTVRVLGADRVGFLTTEQQVSSVVSAILGAVRAVRADDARAPGLRPDEP